MVRKGRRVASLPLMVLTTVDPVFGEAVTAGKITDTVDYDELHDNNNARQTQNQKQEHQNEEEGSMYSSSSATSSSN